MKVCDLLNIHHIDTLKLGEAVMTPLVAQPVVVCEDWIDYNGHMNEAFYITAATQGFEVLTQYIGMDADFVLNQGSYFTLENHNVYMKESDLGDSLISVGQVLDCSEKFIHVYYTVYKQSVCDENAVFCMEQVKVLVSVNTRKSMALPSDMYARLSAICDAHKGLGEPKNIGRKIQIRKK